MSDVRYAIIYLFGENIFAISKIRIFIKMPKSMANYNHKGCSQSELVALNLICGLTCTKPVEMVTRCVLNVYNSSHYAYMSHVTTASSVGTHVVNIQGFPSEC